MKTIINWINAYQFNDLLALYTYWVPLAVCIIVYVCRCAREYRQDVKDCATLYYTPKLTVGIIIWRVILAVLPGINIFALVFDCAGAVFHWIGRVFDMPLVRKQGGGK